jgi:hypothetical protein
MKLQVENLEHKLRAIIATPEFEKLQEAYNDADHVFYFGHGGNMAIAEHAAIDASRLTTKNVQAPGGGVLATSIQGDTNFNDWLMHWIDMRTRDLDKSKCLVVGLSCSTHGHSSDCILTALNWASRSGIESFLVAAQAKEDSIEERVTQIIQGAKYYHTSELISLALTYELIQGSGHSCPTISKKAQERRFESLGIESEVVTSDKDVPPGMDDQTNNLAVDFDGVVHNFNRGWHDGTCYGDPIDGSLEAIRHLAKDWNIVLFTAKVRPDRPLVGDKTGYELVDEWLKKYNIRQYIAEITHEKPRAMHYIDDKAIEFKDNWKDILKRLA